MSGVTWNASGYSPVVGDLVNVIWDRSSGLLVTGTNSAVLVKEVQDVTVVVPSSGWVRYNETRAPGGGAGAGWRNFGFSPSPGTDPLEVVQGPQPQSGDTDDPSYVPELTSWAYVMGYTINIPAGATNARLLLRSTRPALFDWQEGTQQSLVSPFVRGHNYTTAPPFEVEPTWSATYDQWRPVAVTPGESTTSPLPAAWSSALLSGALKGLGFYSASESDVANFEVQLLLTYTPPAGPNA
ncbi:hypothetical protein LQF12_02125 [Ruania suaedae]|uniref:hypothetical protein n=1 Tax=Ruania suaedae TaxID=2897774 RepID=UPI001E2CDFD1|nr:hypothetical protein [Ruania suaedae]UFU03429.1 hypothetical protein LQF12_02125 [Ruania suaedae]